MDGNLRKCSLNSDGRMNDDAIGDGPERAVLTAAMKCIFEEDEQSLWSERGGQYYPTPSQILEDSSILCYRAASTAFWYYWMVFGAAPPQLSAPLFQLVLTAAQAGKAQLKPHSFLFSLEWLNKIDPEAAHTLMPWMTTKCTDSLRRDTSNLSSGLHPDIVSLMARCGLSVSNLHQ